MGEFARLRASGECTRLVKSVIIDVSSARFQSTAFSVQIVTQWRQRCVFMIERHQDGQSDARILLVGSSQGVFRDDRLHSQEQKNLRALCARPWKRQALKVEIILQVGKGLPVLIVTT